jgi:long-chain acyl-CoA synthetase
MSTPTPPTYLEAVAMLTGAGGPFEIETAEVDGRPMRLWKNRERSMREKVANAGLRGDADFLVQGDRRISYGEFAQRVWGTAKVLTSDYGFAKGDRLAVLSYNCPEWLIALFGAVSAGGVGVGLNGWWTTEEIEYGLRDSGSKILIVDERLYPRAEPVIEKIDTLETVLYIGDHAPKGTVPVEDVIVPHDTPPDTPIAEDDAFVILYTSGTTGRPKGCITTHRGTIAQVTGILFSTVVGALTGASAARPEEQRADKSTLVNLMSSPLFHVGGLHSSFCAGMTAGAKLVFTEGRFDPEQVMQLIQDEKVMNWGAIPTMLHRVVHHAKVADYDLSSLRAVSFGGAPTPAETIEKAREVLPIEPSFTNAYGLTETHGVATVNAGKNLLDKMSSVGRPMPLLDLVIRGEDGEPLARGELGELTFFGPLVTPGYWNRPEATAETVRDGWLHTGDLGYEDEDGFFYVVDRAKDMIIRGGENVYCAEIEACLADHPAVDEAAIIADPCPDLGERVHAVVVVHDGSKVSDAELQSHVGAHLAPFKVPERFTYRAERLPRNPAGKILKNLLRGEGAVPFAQEDLDA